MCDQLCKCTMSGNMYTCTCGVSVWYQMLFTCTRHTLYSVHVHVIYNVHIQCTYTMYMTTHIYMLLYMITYTMYIYNIHDYIYMYNYDIHEQSYYIAHYIRRKQKKEERNEQTPTRLKGLEKIYVYTLLASAAYMHTLSSA